MRTRSLTEMLQYEASRKPAVAEILARVDTMSDEELATVKLPMPWYRKALTIIRDEHRFRTLSIDLEKFIKIVPNPDTIGMMCEYHGPTAYVSLERGHLEVATGTLVFFPQKGGVWIDTIFSGKIDYNLHQYASPIKEVSRLDYKEALRQRRNSTVSDVPYTVVAGAPEPPPTWMAGVRFSK